MPSNHLILCHPLLLLPSIFPSRWPKYRTFSFSISPSNEYSGLISFKMDWLDLLADLRALLEPCYSPSGVVYSFLLESGRHSVTALTIRMLRKWHCAASGTLHKTAVQLPCGMCSSDLVLHIRWPKYWSFSFSISPFNEYSGLISLGWTDQISLQSKGLSSVFSTTVQKIQFFNAQPSLWSSFHIHTWLLEKTIA